MELAAGDESDSRPQPGGETETEDDAILAGFLSDQGEGGSLCP